MKLVIAALLIATVAAQTPITIVTFGGQPRDLDVAWTNNKAKFQVYQKTFNKVYDGEAAFNAAFNAFMTNDQTILEHNALDSSYKLGHNEFSDMTPEDFYRTHTGFVNPNENRTKHYNYELKAQAASAPASLDWVAKGAVTPVKNQAQCGSCWAFSTTGSTEGAYQIATGTLLSLSEQDLVSCDNAQHGGSDQGCNGGLMDNAFKWIEKNGICTEEAYPYTSGGGQTGTCKQTCKPAVTMTGFHDVPQKDETSLLAAAAIGPVSVAIEADKSAFQLYKSGILDNKGCGTNLDHGVLIAGYGTDSGKDYWKVKNSWGASWGEKGYIRMIRNKNQCGISQSASYPTGVKQASPGPAPGPSPVPPGPAPGPSPPAGTTHYGDPNKGACMSDEIAIQIQNIQGSVCSPKCTGLIIKSKCPKDVPAGVTATPTCALQDTSSDKYCALICSPTTDEKSLRAGDSQCGQASCKAIQGQGICTYDN